MGAGVIDCAMWDLGGKMLGLSVAQMLGGAGVRAYARRGSEGDGGLTTPEAYADFAEECFALGYRGFKMHGWSDGRHRTTTSRPSGARQARRRPDGADARQCLQLQDLRRRPRGRAAPATRPVSSGTRTPTATAVSRPMPTVGCASCSRPRSCWASTCAASSCRRHWFSPTPPTFVRADPDFDMGITGTMKIAHFAEALGLDVELHAPGPAHRHCMAAIRNTNFYELSWSDPPGRTSRARLHLRLTDALDDVSRTARSPFRTARDWASPMTGTGSRRPQSNTSRSSRGRKWTTG